MLCCSAASEFNNVLTVVRGTGSENCHSNVIMLGVVGSLETLDRLAAVIPVLATAVRTSSNAVLRGVVTVTKSTS